MKKHWWMVLGVAVFAACGPPIEPPPPDEDDETPPDCAPNECEPPPVNSSLWPMTTGSTWTYKITDPVRGTFEKVVRVEGPQQVPGSDLEATLFVSTQPHLTERSWQIEEGGLAKRLLEQDFRADQLVRSTTWDPRTIKALVTQQPVGWESRVAVVETIDDKVTGEIDEKHKEFIWRVVAVDVDITVAGQTMKAIKVQRDREDKDGKERIYWFVPGVGKVREEGEREEVLTSFRIEK